MYWDQLDDWFDADEEVFGHLRDPHHRVDVRRTRQRVRVTSGGQVIADTTTAQVVSETGLPNRYDVPAAYVKNDLFEKSETTTHCPHKGDSEYWTLVGDHQVDDMAWTYPTPFDESS
jgi:uncharacterized protein (DUF427 family)